MFLMGTSFREYLKVSNYKKRKYGLISKHVSSRSNVFEITNNLSFKFCLSKALNANVAKTYKSR